MACVVQKSTAESGGPMAALPKVEPWGYQGATVDPGKRQGTDSTQPKQIEKTISLKHPEKTKNT